ncbi:MAG: hypothetical protein ACE363_07615 [Alphaproteobacteria bacterium]
MVRLTSILAAGLVFTPVVAFAEFTGEAETHPGLAELLAGMPAGMEALGEEKPLTLKLPGATDEEHTRDFLAYREARGARCPDCAAEQVRPTHFYDPTFLRRLGYRWLDKTRVGLAFNAGPFSYGFWGDVREIYNLSSEDSGLVPTLNSVSAAQLDVVASELVIVAPVQDVSVNSPAVSEPEPSVTPSLTPTVDTSFQRSSSPSLASTNVLTNSSANASISRTADFAAVDRGSVSSAKVSAAPSVGLSRASTTVVKTPTPVQTAPVVTANVAPAPAATPSSGGGAEITPQFAPSDDLGRSGSGADTSYTEYIGGFFIAAPF